MGVRSLPFPLLAQLDRHPSRQVCLVLTLGLTFSDEKRSTVHGGLILSLTDTLGSLAIASKGKWMTGVSTDIGTSFVRPAGRLDDVLHARAVVTAMGKRLRCNECYTADHPKGSKLAYTRVDFTNPEGELVAYGCKSPPN